MTTNRRLDILSTAYGVPFKFTGKIDKVTIELKDMTNSDKAKAEKAHEESVLKKALSD